MNLKIKDLKTGQRIYENAGGMEAKLIVVASAKRTRKPKTPGWQAIVKLAGRGNRKPFELFVADECGGYGPRISSSRQYTGKLIN